MANRRVLVKRRKAVRNIRKITRTMQLIATARFQDAHKRALASKPYSEKLAELVGDLSRAGATDHPLMRKPGDAERSALVVMTSNRGLCGGYNAHVLRSAVEQLETARGKGIASDVTMIGKKGVNYFRFTKREIAEKITGIGEKPRFEDVEPLANSLIARFAAGEIGSVHVAYMRFYSTSRQRPEVLQLLPLSPEVVAQEGAGEAAAGEERRVEYEFSPEPEALLDALLPASVRMRLFQCLNDAVVSEQVARMVAMKAATDAAGDMIKNLTRHYNRARQTHITMELLDIVGGANALT